MEIPSTFQFKCNHFRSVVQRAPMSCISAFGAMQGSFTTAELLPLEKVPEIDWRGDRCSGKKHSYFGGSPTSWNVNCWNGAGVTACGLEAEHGKTEEAVWQCAGPRAGGNFRLYSTGWAAYAVRIPWAKPVRDNIKQLQEFHKGGELVEASRCDLPSSSRPWRSGLWTLR